MRKLFGVDSDAAHDLPMAMKYTMNQWMDTIQKTNNKTELFFESNSSVLLFVVPC